MKKLMFLVLSSFFGINSFSQSDCREIIQYGKFAFDSNDIDNVIYRTKRHQVETFNFGKSMVKSNIKWLNDSTMQLIVVECINCPESNYSKEGSEMKVIITSCSKNEYMCKIIYKDNKFIRAHYIRIDE